MNGIHFNQNILESWNRTALVIMMNIKIGLLVLTKPDHSCIKFMSASIRLINWAGNTLYRYLVPCSLLSMKSHCQSLNGPLYEPLFQSVRNPSWEWLTCSATVAQSPSTQARTFTQPKLACPHTLLLFPPRVHLGKCLLRIIGKTTFVRENLEEDWTHFLPSNRKESSCNT